MVGSVTGVEHKVPLPKPSACDAEVKIIGMPATTFYCTLLNGHAYPHEIDALGLDSLNEALEERADSQA